MANPNRIEKEWKEFIKVVGLDAIRPESTQYMEMRRAFFAGGSALLGLIMENLDPGNDMTANDMKVMEQINEEMTNFLKEVLAGRA